MKFEIDIPPKDAWLIVFYEEKVKMRASLGESSSLELEMFRAVEQYALDCMASSVRDMIDSFNPDEKLP